MRRKPRHRPLGYEQLETKAALSALLLPGASPASPATAVAPKTLTAAKAAWTTDDSAAATDGILRFVAANTVQGECADRTAALPTAAQCAAADEMMRQLPGAWDAFIICGFYGDGTEL